MINPAAAAKDDNTASIFRREYQRYVDVFSYPSVSAADITWRASGFGLDV